jgi:hypothetical protein
MRRKSLETKLNLEKLEEKRECIEYMFSILTDFENRDQPLDHWERVHLVEAVNMIFRGGYTMGALQAHFALTPQDERGNGRALPKDDIYMRADLPLLRKALQEAEAEPVRAWTHFGPIVLTNRP